MGSALQGLRMLVAEDDYLMAMEIESILQGFGCIVVGPARSLREVQEMAVGTPLDGALLDVNLRGEPIDKALLALTDRGVKIVLSSGYEEKALRAKYPGVAVITKPYSDSALRTICERVLLGTR